MLDLEELLNAISAARYFPGDPPLFETTAMMSIVAALAGSLLLLLAYVLQKIRFLRVVGRVMVLLLILPMTIVVCAFLGACVGIASRHFGEWAQLKAMLQVESARLERQVKHPGDVITGSEMAQLEIKFLTPPPEFKFNNLGHPVYIRVLSTTPPYVGLDFGDGAHAVLDPVTMICTYAD